MAELPFVAKLDVDDLPLLPQFASGDDDLDEFLRQDAWRLQTENVAVTYCAFSPEGESVLGFATLLVDGVTLQTNERRKLGLVSDDHPVVPGLKLARLAVSKTQHGKGIGQLLVSTAFAAARRLAETAGCRLLVVDSYPDALPFYSRLGFSPNRASQYRDREHPSLRLDVFGANNPDWI